MITKIIRKRLGVNKIYILFLFLALAIIPIISAYNTSQPIIEVSYGEKPVTILDYNLSDIYGSNWSVYPITTPLSGLMVYNFSAYFLDNGDYVFYILANDTDGNWVNGTREFNIYHDDLGVWLHSPVPAVGKTRIFNLTVRTEYDATCKWGTQNPPGACDAICRFFYMPDTFDITGNRTLHTEIFTAPSPDQIIHVSCRSDVFGVNLSSLTNYGATHFMAGYDTIPPIMGTPHANPNPIIDANWKLTTINVSTNEPTVCHIRGGNESHQNANWGWKNEYFPDEDPLNYTSYRLNHEINVSYLSVEGDDSYNFMYNITCYDRAKWTDEKFLFVLFQLNSTLTITQITPSFVGDLSIPYEIRTNINVLSCSLKLNGEPDWHDMLPNTPRNYTYDVDLELGLNNMEVLCIVYPDSATAYFNVTADNERPTMQLEMYSDTCSLEHIDFRMNATDEGTGVALLNWSVWHGDEIIQNWTTTDPDNTDVTYDGDLIEGESYTIKANSIDNAGLQSPDDEKSIIAHGSTYPTCDTTAPTATISFVGDVYQKNVTVNCTDNDDGTGCSPTFDYEAMDYYTGSCVYANYTDTFSYTNLPLVLEQDAFLCVRVSDNADNYGYANITVPVTIVTCGNNVADPAVQGHEIEQCDGTDLREFTCDTFPDFNGGILACMPPDGSSEQCTWDTSNCQMGNRGYCGDNITNNYYFEQCDGTLSDGDWGQITSCTDFNFTGGSLKCNPYTMPENQRCKFNTTDCTKTPWNPTPNCDGLAGSYLTFLDPNEQCEPYLFDNRMMPLLSCSDFDNFTDGNLTCLDSCLLDLGECFGQPDINAFCGDGTINGGETCERPGDTMSCDDLDDGVYTGGTLVCGEDCDWVEFTCTPKPVCGDGVRAGNDEMCDGEDLGNMTCSDVGSNIGGTLACNADCTLDESNCDQGLGYCGDNLINNGWLEQCDNNSWGRITSCTDFGFTGGTLSCYEPFTENQCMFDTSQCTDNFASNSCDNRILESGEQCERDRPFTVGCYDFDSYTEGEISCDYSTCFYDTSDCRVGEQYCGDGIVQPGEMCDITDFGDLNDCSDIRPGLSGPLVCFPQGHTEACTIDESACSGGGGGNGTGYCGDGTANGFEKCDGTDLGGVTCDLIYPFVGGELGCYPSDYFEPELACTYDKSRCDIGQGYCGDNVANNLPNEQCDGANPLTGDWGDIRTCQDINSVFTGGTLQCNGCQFDTSLCDDGLVGAGECGDNILQTGEQCDPVVPAGVLCSDFDSLDSGDLSCSEECTILLDDCGIDPDPLCDNGQIEPTEQCDGTDLAGSNLCAVREPTMYTGGTVFCNPQGTPGQCLLNYDNCDYDPQIGPYCGDGVANGQDEYCDGNDLGLMSCSEISGFQGGILACNPDCSFDVSNCDSGPGYCGDNIINNFANEQCDGATWGNVESCSDFGFTGGTLTCNSASSPEKCLFNTSQCTATSTVGICGDDILIRGEQCEENRPLTLGCTDFDSFLGGDIECNYGTCRYDISGCTQSQGGGYCGDGLINDFPNEECDDNDWGNIDSCSDIDPAFTGGSLSCSNDCGFDTSSCTSIHGSGVCGDGEINPTESCEEGVSLGAVCTDFDAFIGGTLGCDYATCQYNLINCDTAENLYCGDGILTTGLGEFCDGTSIGPITECSQFDDRFISGQIGCTNDCQYDLSGCQLPGEPYCGDGIANNLEDCDGADMGLMSCGYIDTFDGGILRCNPDCSFDTSNCNAGQGYCGDNIINNNPFEQCDGVDWGNIHSCAEFGFNAGTLTCNPPDSPNRCLFNTSQCSTPAGFGNCGNQILNRAEQCEQNRPLTLACVDFDAFTGGDIACNYGSCIYDISDCIKSQGSGYCGDGAINNFPNEECDADDWGNINSCSDIDPAFTGGSLSCGSSNSADPCRFDTSSCTGPPPGVCGDETINPTESCEEGVSLGAVCTDFDQFVGGTLGCDYDTCEYDLLNCDTEIELYCGDGVITPGIGEECDGDLVGAITECSQFDNRFISGQIGCTNNCQFDLSNCEERGEAYCGDGIANNLEDCDGSDLGLMSCDFIDTFSGGILGCNLDCSFDTSNCNAGPGFCGDNIINNFANEQCDGDSWGEVNSCVDFGFTGGTLTCNPPDSPNRCLFNTSQCTTPAGFGTCGNQILNRAEQCEANRPLTLTCNDFDAFVGGDIACNYGSCIYDISDCTQSQGSGYCGDGTINNFPNEECDSDDWGNIDSCSDIDPAFTGGSLSCGSSNSADPCRFDTSSCTGPPPGVCGDGTINPTESCEVGVPLSAVCTNFDQFVGGTLGCDYDTCEFNLLDCQTEEILYCGDGVITPGIGEECDGDVIGQITECSEFDNRFVSGQIACASDCQFDLSDCVLGDEEAYCGDGAVNAQGEQCDGMNMGGATCSDIGGFMNGELSCFPPGSGYEVECKWDTSNCNAGYGYCGDGVINNLWQEQCDSYDWGEISSCADLGFNGGTLICNPPFTLNQCIFNTSSCTGIPGGYCGDQVLNPGEECETNRPLASQCTDFDNFIGGVLACDYSTCIYDISDCTLPTVSVCGDGFISGYEECDGTNYGGNTCTDIGNFIGGTIGCYPESAGATACTYDVSSCTPDVTTGYCGDGQANGDEDCDGTDLGLMSCSLIDTLTNGVLACNSDCSFDTSNCDAGQGWCGDGIINNFPLEKCDGDNWGDISTCADFGFTGGTLSCNSCGFDTSACTTPAGSGTCGNQILNIGEECELNRPLTLECSDFDSFTGGTIACNYGTCKYDISNCEQSQGTGYCGDGLINDFPNEACDGNNWGNINSCSDIDSAFTGGSLSCDSDCRFNTNSCTSVNGNGICGDEEINNGELCEEGVSFGAVCTDFDSFVGGNIACDYTICDYDLSNCDTEVELYCGDGVITPGLNEECDGNIIGQVTECSEFDTRFISGQIGCTTDCQFDLSDCEEDIVTDEYCGDGVLNDFPNEQCDMGTNGQQCSDFNGFIGGTLTCADDCTFDTTQCQSIFDEGYCGDGIANSRNEYCDGNDLGLMSCSDIDTFGGGILSCNSDCTFDMRNCDAGQGYCGDNIINHFPDEQCDGDNWGEITSCADFGFTGGTLSCNSCGFDTSACTTPAGYGVCGDQILNRDEQCERNRPLTLGCTDFDAFTGGIIGCDYSTCMYDIADCEQSQGTGYCGDDIINDFPNEQCDGDDWGNIDSCSDIDSAFTGGTLSCSNDCGFNTNNCDSENGEGDCGDGEINNGELCEEGVSLGATCSEIDEFTGGTMGCYYDTCDYDLSNCETEHDLYCGDGVITPGIGEQCDGDIIGPVTECSEFRDSFISGQLGCTSDCQFDLSNCVGEQNGVCGDDELNSGEQCEPGQTISMTCADMGFLSGTLSCYGVGNADECQFNINNCVPAIDLGYCGDGYIIPDQEWCDSNNLGGLDCTYFDNFVDGILGCDTFCNWDTSNCDIGTGHCGDGIINNPYNEQCDGSAWGRITSCTEFGFDSGTLSCYAPESENRCTFDTSNCNTPAGNGVCGNSILNKGEQCEVGMAFDLGCTDFDGYIGGEISCDYTTCQYVLDECTVPSVSVCGDGFISGSEECDGLNLGPTTLCEDLDDEFDGGSITCHPVGSRRECRFDISDCTSIVTPSDCGNNIVEEGEECDGTKNLLNCEDFGLTSGFLGCNNCEVNTTSCIDTEVEIQQACGNDRTEPSEECDGAVEELFQESFAQLYSCEFGVGCSDSCTIDCLSQVLYTCDNLIRDGDETGFNCGGSCPACDVGESCETNTDCKTGKCFEGICQEEQCMNGVQDGDETGVDCGGSCAACSDGEYCFSDNDCQSGRCIEGICMPAEEIVADKPNTAGIILIIIGLLLMLGGGGYVIYEEYFDKNKHAPPKVIPLTRQQQVQQQQTMTIDPKILEMQKKKQEERRQQQQDARKSLLDGFDKESAPKGEDDLETLKEKRVNKDVLKEAGYIDLTEEKPKEKESADIFDKLKKIGDKDKTQEERKVGLETYAVEGEEGEKKTTDASSAGAGVLKKSRNKNQRLVKVKKKSETFEKLGSIGQDVSKESIRSTSGKISELSGKNKSSITKVLSSDNISQKQANNIFSNLDKEKLTSDVFKEILSDLVSKGKLSKETVSGMLFEYMDNGTLDKSDVAKIMSQLNMV